LVVVVVAAIHSAVSEVYSVIPWVEEVVIDVVRVMI
jgi:hypothetical protein